MNKKLTIYLSAAYDEKEYREKVKSLYGNGANLIDPIEDLTKLETDNTFGLSADIWVVHRDKKLILSSDLVVAYIDSAGTTVGTTMEILYAYENKIPVYLIDPKMKYCQDYWMTYHIKRTYYCIEDCFERALGLTAYNPNSLFPELVDELCKTQEDS